MAVQAGIKSDTAEYYKDELEAFAKLVAAKERERIEKEWDKLYGWWTPDEEKNT
jgi:hypothetical protein